MCRIRDDSDFINLHYPVLNVFLFQFEILPENDNQ